MLLPLFNEITGRHLETAYFSNIEAIPAVIFSILFIGFLAGSYPAFFISSFKPAAVLGSKISIFKNSWLRSGLVVFQFAISIILIIGTLVVYLQMQYIQNIKLGFDKDHILVIQRAWALENQAGTFKDELVKNTGIISASNSDNMPGQLFSQNLFRTEGADTKQHIVSAMSSDYDFAKTMGIEIVQGRYFSRDYPSDTMSVVVNETAIKIMDLKDPIGKRVITVGNPDPARSTFRIIGVMKDFHYESLHQKIRPMIMFLNRGQTAFLPIRIRTTDFAGSISTIEKLWKKFVPDKPLEYYFLNDNFDQLYRAEHKTSQIFTTFSVISIFIACLGLLGLASFTAERRTKEIGIRKVMGASTSGIIFLLSKEFIKWVLIANIIAWPIAFYIMNSWLEDFAYRIGFPYWILIASALIAMLIAIITVISQALKAANSNPIKSLRYE
jgi:putative ABC transport system permease protein